MSISVEDTPDLISATMEKLQAGERTAVPLAESIRTDIMIDEKAARLIASQRRFPVTGEAATLGLSDLTQAIDRPRKASLRRSPALFKATLERYGRPLKEIESTVSKPYQNSI